MKHITLLDRVDIDLQLRVIHLTHVTVVQLIETSRHTSKMSEDNQFALDNLNLLIYCVTNCLIGEKIVHHDHGTHLLAIAELLPKPFSRNALNILTGYDNVFPHLILSGLR